MAIKLIISSQLVHPSQLNIKTFNHKKLSWYPQGSSIMAVSQWHNLSGGISGQNVDIVLVAVRRMKEQNVILSVCQSFQRFMTFYDSRDMTKHLDWPGHGTRVTMVVTYKKGQPTLSVSGMAPTIHIHLLLILPHTAARDLRQRGQ